MKKGDLITGVLMGFTYVGQDVTYCKVSVKTDKGVIHRTLAGTADIFDFSSMLTLKGAGASVSMKFDKVDTYTDRNGDTVEYDRFTDFEWSLV